MARASRGEDVVHRTWLTVGERLHRKLQRQAARRAARSRGLRYAAGSEGADRALASHIQHGPPAQLTGLPGPGTGGDPALFVRFGYASANEQGWHIGNTNPNLNTGSIPGGRSGFADNLEIEGGTTVAQLFEREMGRHAKAEDYLIRVNRQPCAR